MPNKFYEKRRPIGTKTYEVYEKEGLPYTKVQCIECYETIEIPLILEHFELWIGGELIQDAMPELGKGLRELLISGVCDPCFNAMFPPADGSDDE